MANLIEVKDIYKSFDKQDVLKGVDLSVNKGEIVGIIGASGSGKSTLIRCIACLEKIQSGKVFLMGKEVFSYKDVAGKIGMVFQNFNLFPHYNVLDNISKPLQTVKKLSKKEADIIAEQELERVKLLHTKEQYPSTLSGGQKQRLAIARAMAMNPEILVFDEPTSSLDPELAHEVFQTINDLAKEGQTMLIVTHQLNAISHFATRIAFLHDGVIEVDDTAEKVFGNNPNKHLQTFLKMVKFDEL